MPESGNWTMSGGEKFRDKGKNWKLHVYYLIEFKPCLIVTWVCRHYHPHSGFPDLARSYGIRVHCNWHISGPNSSLSLSPSPPPPPPPPPTLLLMKSIKLCILIALFELHVLEIVGSEGILKAKLWKKYKHSISILYANSLSIHSSSICLWMWLIYLSS